MFVVSEQHDEKLVHVGNTQRCPPSSGHFLQVSALCGAGDCSLHIIKATNGSEHEVTKLP